MGKWMWVGSGWWVVGEYIVVRIVVVVVGGVHVGR